MGFHGPVSLLICSLILWYNFGTSSSAPLQDAWELNWLFENQDDNSNVNIPNSYNENINLDLGIKSDTESESRLIVQNPSEFTWPFDWSLDNQISTINDDNSVEKDVFDWNFDWLYTENNEKDERNVVPENSENSLTSLPFDWPFEHKEELENKINKPTKENVWFPEFPLKIADTNSFELTTEDTKSNSWTFGWPFETKLYGTTTPRPSTPTIEKEPIHEIPEDISELNITYKVNPSTIENKPNKKEEESSSEESSEESKEKSEESKEESEEEKEESEDEKDETATDEEIHSTDLYTDNSTSADLLPEVTTDLSDVSTLSVTDYLEENINVTETVLYDVVDYEEGSGQEEVTTIQGNGEIDITTETTEVLAETEQVYIEEVTEAVYSDD